MGSLAAFPNSRPSRASSKGSLEEKPGWVWPQISTLCSTLTRPAAPRPQLSSKSHFSYPAISPKYKFWRKGRGGKPQHRHNTVFEGAGRGLVPPKRGLQETLARSSAKESKLRGGQSRKKEIKSTALCIIFWNVRTCRERIVFGCFHKPLPTLIKAFRKLRKPT